MSIHSLRKIPATIVTGFLGTGKTTLIRHLLETNHGRRIAIIINEVGDVGVDRSLLQGCGSTACVDSDIVELTNGCLCCIVADSFLPVMENLIGRANPPDHIVIETSGLALPKPLVQAFQWPTLRQRVTVDGVVAVIDAMAIADGRLTSASIQKSSNHDNPFAEVFINQILCSDLVLLNKVDLLKGDGLTIVVKNLVTYLRAGVKLLPVCYCKVDPNILLGLEAGVEDNLSVRPSSHDNHDNHDHDDFESFTVTLPTISDIRVLEGILMEVIITNNILRVKGFLNVHGKEMRLAIQCVGPRIQHYFDRPWGTTELRHSQLVVIGMKGLDQYTITAYFSRAYI